MSDGFIAVLSMGFVLGIITTIIIIGLCKK